MIKELLRAFLLIFVAEMGDKTQIIAMIFATKYKIKDVLLGVIIGVLLNHGIAIILGSFISKVVPINYIQIIAGALFIIFGFIALKNDDEDDDVENNKALNPIKTVALAFFIGELGDKTQLTAMTLSAESIYPLFVLLGTTLGMVATSSLGIFVGRKIGPKIPEVAIKIVSSIVFIFFGFHKLFNSLPEVFLTQLNILIFMVIILTIELLVIKRLIDNRKVQGASRLKEAATNLYEQTKLLKETLDSICLGETKCGKCTGTGCLLGYTRYILNEARENDAYYNKLQVNIKKLIKKDYDKSKVMQALLLIIIDYNKYGWNNSEDFIINKIKSSLEFILFGIELNRSNNIIDYINEAKSIDYNLGIIIEKGLN